MTVVVIPVLLLWNTLESHGITLVHAKKITLNNDWKTPGILLENANWRTTGDQLDTN
jgi:hypothetical protein